MAVCARLRAPARDEPRQAEVVPLSPLPPSLPPDDRLKPCRPGARDADSDAAKHGVQSEPNAVQSRLEARVITSLADVDKASLLRCENGSAQLAASDRAHRDDARRLKI